MARVGWLLIAAAGCSWSPKPYSADPLVRHRGADRGDPTRLVRPSPTPAPEPPGAPVNPPPRG